MKELLDKIKLFVLDMDGTFYLGENQIDGALEFTRRVRETGRDFVFFTNNSSKNGVMYVEKLNRMGCPVSEKDIMTSGDVTVEYLKTNYPGQKVYLAGTPALEALFQKAGICLTKEKPDVVVVGFDMTLTYEKLERVCTYIREGAVFWQPIRILIVRRPPDLYRIAEPCVRQFLFPQACSQDIWGNPAGRRWIWFYAKPAIRKKRLLLWVIGFIRMWRRESIMALWEYLFSAARPGQRILRNRM